MEGQVVERYIYAGHVGPGGFCMHSRRARGRTVILPGSPRFAWSVDKSGWMEIQFVVSGVVPGFQYRVMLEAIAEGSEGSEMMSSGLYYKTTDGVMTKGNAIHQWELVWPDTEEHELLARFEVPHIVGEAGVITGSDAELRQFYHFDTGRTGRTTRL
jgi:hypothetical protein